MTQINPPEGLLDLTKLLPEPISDAIRNTVEVILGPTGPNVGDPQPEGQRPIPTTDPQELNAAVKAIDAVLDGIELILKLSFIIPAQYEAPLRALSGALKTIRNWLV